MKAVVVVAGGARTSRVAPPPRGAPGREGHDVDMPATLALYRVWRRVPRATSTHCPRAVHRAGEGRGAGCLRAGLPNLLVHGQQNPICCRAASCRPAPFRLVPLGGPACAQHVLAALSSSVCPGSSGQATLGAGRFATHVPTRSYRVALCRGNDRDFERHYQRSRPTASTNPLSRHHRSCTHSLHSFCPHRELDAFADEIAKDKAHNKYGFLLQGA